METKSLFRPLQLPCGVSLKNRIVKAPMSDALGTGHGLPSEAQVNLYGIWAHGGAGLLAVGEVQVDSGYPENPGNLVLANSPELPVLGFLTRAASVHETHLWAQLGHGGAMAHAAACADPAGPSAFEREEFTCRALTIPEIKELPGKFATAARNAKEAGFTGVQIHAAHGFLLSQFLSPLFNRREDHYGGSTATRFRLVNEVIEQTRDAVGDRFPIGIKVNSSDELEGSLSEGEALDIVRLLDATSVDLIEISGGTYIPGFRKITRQNKTRPYYLPFARAARNSTTKPLLLTGGIRTCEQAVDVLESGVVDAIGLGRALVLDPNLPARWLSGDEASPAFPRFASSPDGGITAWYTELIGSIAGEPGDVHQLTVADALARRRRKDQLLAAKWNGFFRDQLAPPQGE